nr:MAG TPA: hypothetical protein [Caudoviricetes sp.]
MDKTISSRHPRKENDSFILYPTGSMNIICLF